ncbi:hypothetical protein JCM13580A_07270 [Streptomyces drozdowiczii]
MRRIPRHGHDPHRFPARRPGTGAFRPPGRAAADAALTGGAPPPDTDRRFSTGSGGAHPPDPPAQDRPPTVTEEHSR